MDQMLQERQQGQQPPLLPPLPEQQHQAANTRGSWPSLQGSWAGVAAEDSQAHYWRADGQPEAARMASEQRSGEAAHTGGQQLNGAGISGWEGEAGGHRLASEARQLDAGAGWAPGMEWEGQAAGPVEEAWRARSASPAPEPQRAQQKPHSAAAAPLCACPPGTAASTPALEPSVPTVSAGLLAVHASPASALQPAGGQCYLNEQPGHAQSGPSPQLPLDPGEDEQQAQALPPLPQVGPHARERTWWLDLHLSCADGKTRDVSHVHACDDCRTPAQRAALPPRGSRTAFAWPCCRARWRSVTQAAVGPAHPRSLVRAPLIRSGRPGRGGSPWALGRHCRAGAAGPRC